MIFTGIFFLLALFAHGSASPGRLPSLFDLSNDHSRIVGGTEADAGEFPHQISLRFDGKHFCGGSILDKRNVISAAHCTIDLNNYKNRITILVGTNNRLSGGQTYGVQSIINHEGYSPSTFVNDICLIQTKSDIEMSEIVKPISLCETFVEAGYKVVVSGWGRHKYPQDDLPVGLLKLEYETISTESCLEDHKGKRWGDKVSDSQVCARSKKGEGACHGDSGGPLLLKELGCLLGVVSWGQPCAVGLSDVYTRISAYLEWIEKNRT